MNTKIRICACLVTCMLGACAPIPARPSAAEILREARQLARAAREEDFLNWVERVDTMRIICMDQVAAGDLEGAWETADAIVGVLAWGDRRLARIHIAEAWAEMGRMDRARAILEQMGLMEDMADSIKGCAVRYRASLGQVEAAAQIARGIHREADRLRSMLDLAKECVRIGKVAQARSLVREILQGVESSEDTSGKLMSLLEPAEIIASLGDPSGALEALEKARGIVAAIDGDKSWDIAWLATSQARAGFFYRAFSTAAQIQEEDEELWEEALRDIGIAQARAGHLNDAAATASLITSWRLYKDRLLLEVVRGHLRQENPTAAMIAAGSIPDPSRKAQALLEVAAAQARMGDKDGARRTASSIDLILRRWDWAKEGRAFDYSSPATWGNCYNYSYMLGPSGFSGAIERASEVAAAAMELDQALGGRDAVRYLEAFVRSDPGVLRRLARAQAAAGNPEGALAWARRLANPANRAYALMGVAEGVIEIAPSGDPACHSWFSGGGFRAAGVPWVPRVPGTKY